MDHTRVEGNLVTVEERLEALERRVANLEQAALPHQPFGPNPTLPFQWNAGQCLICGAPGGHGNLQCPQLSPRSTSSEVSAR